MRYAITALLCLLFFTGTSLASPKVALVIGNGDYTSAPLENPVNNANDMSNLFIDLGFDVITETNATKRIIFRTIDNFTEKLEKAEIGLFYYAGHGKQINGINYLIPTKSYVNIGLDVETEGVDVNRVLGRMKHAGNGLNMVILDACRNNPFAHC